MMYLINYICKEDNTFVCKLYFMNCITLLYKFYVACTGKYLKRNCPPKTKILTHLHHELFPDPTMSQKGRGVGYSKVLRNLNLKYKLLIESSVSRHFKHLNTVPFTSTQCTPDHTAEVFVYGITINTTH